MASTTRIRLAIALDEEIDRIHRAMPEALGVSVARSGDRFVGGEPLMRSWTVTIQMPRRDSAGRRQRGRIEPFNGHGETIEEAAEKALQFVRYKQQGLL